VDSVTTTYTHPNVVTPSKVFRGDPGEGIGALIGAQD